MSLLPIGNFLSPLAKRAGQELEQAVFGTQTNERALVLPQARPPIFSAMNDDAAHAVALRERACDFREQDIARREVALTGTQTSSRSHDLVVAGVAFSVGLAFGIVLYSMRKGR